MEFSSIQEWVLQFIKHKDIFDRKVTKLEENSEGVRVTRKDGSVVSWIAKDAFSYSSKEKTTASSRMIACLNTRENVKEIVKHWKELVLDSALTIWCVDLETGEKWSVTPRVHDLITEPSALEQGLLSLMDTANGVVKEEPKRKKKQSIFEESENSEAGKEEET